ncbi:MAG: SOS response-associated peptidase family protein [Lachnospiraceae bacterium]|nr:SOS response-associated peptidase family protein [Lachnospiraceae bacterium]
MCGRYYVDDETAREIERLVEEVDAKMRLKQGNGDVLPSQEAVVIRGREAVPSDGILRPEQKELLCADRMRWGYSSPKDNRLLINARAETAKDRLLFAQDVRYHRIAVPAAGFYEWDSDHNRASFTARQGAILFLAGFYRYEVKEKRFIILTTAANESMAPVHDRMPVMIERSELRQWIYGEQYLDMFLQRKQAQLCCRREYEQLRLF